MINKIKNIQPVPPWNIIRAKHVAIPSEHGAWIFLFSPLLIGLFIGGFSSGTIPLILTLLSAFLIRQPMTIFVKVFSGRRPQKDLYPALIWLIIYGIALISNLIILILQKYVFILLLALPAVPVFIWHLWLVSKRAERRQKLIEIAASGVLALAAPATFWVGQQQYSPTGWLLWVFTWLQVTGTILYAYLRLEQRQLKQQPTLKESIKMSSEAFIFNLILFISVLVIAITGSIPTFLPLAFLIQPLEVIWGILNPAISEAPKKIGIRQLLVSSIFTVSFIVAWLIN